MKLGVLFSGGKDSFYALYKAQQYEDVVCLISLLSGNKESYMFHTPGQVLLRYQAEATGIPLLAVKTAGEKEKELDDLKKAIIEAKKKYKIQGIVTGAIASTYQALRVERICHELGMWCFNPLWQRDQEVHLYSVIDEGFVVGINAVAAESLGKEWLGRIITKDVAEELAVLGAKKGINPAGEGGEFETFVLDSPVHKKKLIVSEPKIVWDGSAGYIDYKKITLRQK